MDLVDIDKVLDDFELNEDNNEYNNATPSNLLKVVNNNQSESGGSGVVNAAAETYSTSIRTSAKLNDDYAERYSTTGHVPATTLSSSSTNNTANKHFVNVSNVFSSLNDYVNAGIDKGLASINLNEDIKVVADGDSSHSSDSIIENVKTPNNVKLKTKRPKSPLSSGSNSTSPGSTRSSSATSSRRTTPTTSPHSSDCEDEEEEVVTKTNEKSLIQGGIQENSMSENGREEEEAAGASVDQISDIRTNSNVNNKTNTIFSSSSSYCYNENNSSDVTFSNDIVSLNETSSLSSLVNISHNEGGVGGGRGGVTDMEIISEELNVNSPDIDTIDRSSVMRALGDNDVPNIQDMPNDVPQIKRAHETVTKPIGFESTMDDVSDTELESYLQELEFETNSINPPVTLSSLEVIEEKEEKIVMEKKQIGEEEIVEKSVKSEILDDKSADKIVANVEKPKITADEEEEEVIIIPSSSSSSDEFKEKNVDNISQASTIECNEVVTSHTDLDDDKIRSATDNVIKEEAVAAATAAVTLPVVVEVAEDKLLAEGETASLPVAQTEVADEHSEVTTELTNTATPPPKRPTSLNFPAGTTHDEESTSPGQTPPTRIPDEGQLSSCSDDIVTNPLLSEAQPDSDSLAATGMSAHQIGRVAPYWVPDSDAINCMQCQLKFSLIKRRHHCRACGKVLCSVCCSMKGKLEYLGDVEARICLQCDVVLSKREQLLEENNPLYQASASSSQPYRNSPDPNNPMEYCSRLPPHQQVSAQQGATPFSVMVPVGVLKREGTAKSTRKEKNVIFSDGIRPGCDLTELDHNWDSKASSSSSYGRKSGSKRVQTPPDPSAMKAFRSNTKLPRIDESTNSFIPQEENALPPIYQESTKTEFKFTDVTNDAQLIARLHQEEVKFAIQRNFFVCCKIINLSCCVNKTVINFTTLGMRYVGQDEIVILLQLDDTNNTSIPKDVFTHLNEIYQNADKGQTITELGFSIPRQQNFLGSKEHGGFIYIRPTFQCFQCVTIPESPYLIGILIHRWEVPWAKVFPLRLMLRLGALYRYYPSPHISERGRDSVYAEIAQTVINFLADFRNYAYTLPTIRGMTIHMEDRKTTIRIPRNRYDQVVKAISNSSDHILALAGIFSKKADGHLVCIQNTESGCPEMYQYSTQAINIQGQPRKVTGASFLILNGALKTTSGLSGKCTIVEDGLMVQILPATMIAAREALKNIKDYNFVCGPVDATPEQTETVSLIWTENDVEFNVGVLSPIDGKELDGTPSIRVHKGMDHSNTNHMMRWTEVFILKADEELPHGKDQIDVSKVSEKIARAVGNALVTFLDLLAANKLIKLGLRVTIDPENVCYEAGSQQTKLPPLYMNALDNELIPTLHRQASNLQTDTPLILELIFHILDK